MRDASEVIGSVADEALPREDMGGGGSGRYSGGMKPPAMVDEKSNGYVDPGDFIYNNA